MKNRKHRRPTASQNKEKRKRKYRNIGSQQKRYKPPSHSLRAIIHHSKEEFTNYENKEYGGASQEISFEEVVKTAEQFKKYKTYINQKRIRFLSLALTFFKVRSTSHTSKIRVYTKKRIPPNVLFDRVEAKFPKGCKITFHFKYNLSHTFDVQASLPLTYNEFAWRICEALEEYL